MNDGITISAFQLFEMFPDKEQARIYLENQRWNGNVVCPHCDSGDKITARQGKRLGYYRCRTCKVEFTVRTGTILERSPRSTEQVAVRHLHARDGPQGHIVPATVERVERHTVNGLVHARQAAGSLQR